MKIKPNTEPQSEVLKALANPMRLAVLHELRRGERTATELVRACGVSKANLSQHLNVLKNGGLVRCKKRGVYCHYSISDRRILKALDLIAQIYLKRTS